MPGTREQYHVRDLECSIVNISKKKKLQNPVVKQTFPYHRTLFHNYMAKSYEAIRPSSRSSLFIRVLVAAWRPLWGVGRKEERVEFLLLNHRTF